jgi:magnesium transporter
MGKFKKISKKIELIEIDNPKIKRDIKWYNISDPQKKEIDYLKRKFSFREKHLEASMAEISSQRPMISRGSNYLFIILHFPVVEKKQIIPSEIEFFVGHGFLVTLHDKKTKALNNFFNSCKEDSIFLESYRLESSSILLYEILEKLIENSYSLLDENNIEIDETERKIFSQEQKIITSQLLTLKSNIINIRRIVQNHKNIMKSLTEMKSSLVPQKQLKSYYEVLAEHSHRIWEFSDIQKEKIESLHNTSESIMSYKINNIIKTLTIVSVILLPLNLFVTMFGMNLDPTPIENNPVYFIKIVVMLVILSIIMVVFFKKKKWL